MKKLIKIKMKHCMYQNQYHYRDRDQKHLRKMNMKLTDPSLQHRFHKLREKCVRNLTITNQNANKNLIKSSLNQNVLKICRNVEGAIYLKKLIIQLQRNRKIIFIDSIKLFHFLNPFMTKMIILLERRDTRYQ